MANKSVDEIQNEMLAELMALGSNQQSTISELAELIDHHDTFLKEIFGDPLVPPSPLLQFEEKPDHTLPPQLEARLIRLESSIRKMNDFQIHQVTVLNKVVESMDKAFKELYPQKQSPFTELRIVRDEE